MAVLEKHGAAVKVSLSLLLLLLLLLCVTAAEPVTVYRNGMEEFLVRSSYSATLDIVVRVHSYANEAAWLVDKSVPLLEYRKGKIINEGGDDYPAAAFENYGFLGGNHGSAYARVLLIPDHEMTDRDMGGRVTEEDGYAYYIVRILDKDRIIIHPEGTTDTFHPHFRRHEKAPLFYNGKPLNFKESLFAQLYPMNRIIDHQLLLDGKTPLPDCTEVECQFLELILSHDVLLPQGVVRWIQSNPGKASSPELVSHKQWQLLNTPELRAKYPEYAALPALATYTNRFRFAAPGSCVMQRRAVYHTSLSSVSSLDVMLRWDGWLSQAPEVKFYIPKLKPVTLKGYKDGADLECDFSAVQLLPQNMSVNDWITPADCLDPNDLPDRFIRLLREGERKLGVAVGYSLILGCSAEAVQQQNRPKLYHFWHSKKLYPYLYTLTDVKPGTTIESCVYKRYFNPDLEPDATSYYWNRQGESDVVYLDFHRDLTGKTIKLPAEFTNKRISVVEQTPSLVLHSSGRVPATGICLDVKNGFGYLVLKLDEN